MSIVIPCLNEVETIGACVEQARRALDEAGVRGEVVVADNGSTDDSIALSVAAGARVVSVPHRGYGSALQGGINAAQGTYILMGDADGSYDFNQLTDFLVPLRQGYDLVMGNRFRGGIKPGAMPWLHRWIGNPGLTRLGELLFGTDVGDFHCGLRAFSKAAYARMAPSTPGMEFASELVIRASLQGMAITEVPATLSKDGRSRKPHLRTWRDGWRHLRFMLLYSPRWLFLVPGLALLMLGSAISLWLLPGQRNLGRIGLDIHTLLLASSVALVGYQLVWFAACSKIFAVNTGLHPPSKGLNRLFRYVRLETGLLLGGGSVAIAMLMMGIAFREWEARSFAGLDPRLTMRVMIPAVFLLVAGMQTIFSSFFFAIVGMIRPPDHGASPQSAN